MRHLILLSVCAAGAFAADATYNVGVGIADVTGPAANVNLMGYANPGQTAGGIHQRLRSRAFVFADPTTQRRACFVSVDAGMCSQYMKNKVVEALEAQLPGVYSTENVLISGTHTHSAPAGFFQYVLFEITSWGFVKEAADAFVSGIVRSVLAAHKDVAPASMKLGSGKVDNTTVPGCPMPNCANINRSPTAYLRNPAAERARYPDGDTDHTMAMLKVLSADGKATPRAMANWYAVHGTSMNNTNSLLSGDNKGYASYLFERHVNGGPDKVRTGTGAFVAAFAQTNLGDVSPNTNGTYCMDTGLPCDSTQHSTCPNAKGEERNAMCVGRGPGQDMFGSAQIVGERQFVAAQSVWADSAAATDIGEGGVDYRHVFVDMTAQNVSLPDGTYGRTCTPAMGYAFAAGTTDGPGAFDFTQGSNSSNPFWNLVSGFISKPTQAEKDCQAPKPILLNTGDCSFPYPWSPHVVPVQIMRVGQLVILGVPAEVRACAYAAAPPLAASRRPEPPPRLRPAPPAQPPAARECLLWV